MHARLLASLFVVVVGLALGGEARAASDPAAAEVLFREGRRAADEGDLATACAKFAESYRLEAAPGTLLNLADCEDRSDNLATAWAHVRQVYDVLPDGDERKGLAEARAAAALTRVPWLQISVRDASSLKVTRDDVVISTFGIYMPVDRGKHTIVARAPGYVERAYEVQIADGERKELEIAPLERVAPPPVTQQPSAPREHAVVQSSGSGQRTIGYLLGGTGLVALGAGGVLGAIALDAQAQSNALCTNGVCSSSQGVDAHQRAKTFALATDVLFATGAALFAMGVVVVLTAPRDHAPLLLRVGPTGVGIGGAW